MKVICDREKFRNAFSIAASVASSRSPMPILQNVKLDVGVDSAVVMATDTELGVRLDVPGVQSEVPGSVILPVDRFGLILSESSDASLRMETDGENIVVRGERSEFRLPAENPLDFPNVAGLDTEACLELPARSLRELIRRTVFATTVERAHYALGGVLLEQAGEKLTAVATDGHRLAVMEAQVKVVGDYKPSDAMTIVRTKSMQFLDKTLSDNDGDVQIVARDNDVVVRSQRSTIYSLLVEGRFPQWRSIIPRREGTQRINVVAGPLLSAVMQAAIVATEESRGIYFTFNDGKLVLVGRSAQKGQSRIELPIAYDGPSLTVRLDYRYMRDFLRVLDPSKPVTADVKDAESAVVFTTDDHYTSVIMPMEIQE